MTDLRYSWALGMIWFLLRTEEQELRAFFGMTWWNFLRDILEAGSANLSAGSWKLRGI